MTLFAVACAGIFPLFHTGRPWLAYWLLPYPNTMGVWPQFRSPLIWDVFAVSTYATVSLLFWFVGLIPDLATLRDRSQSQDRAASSTACWRWAGAARRGTGTATRPPTCCSPAWRRRWSSRCTRSSASTSPSAIVPGWHTTIFPPYFVAGAIYSGFAMVLTLAIPIRAVYGLEDFITMRHLQNMAKVMLVDRPDRRLRLHDRGVHRLVQRQHVRRLHDLEPHDRAVRAGLLGADLLQRRHAAAAVVQARAHERVGAVRHLAHRQRRHVARAVRHHRHQPAPRLPAVVVGHVPADVLGLVRPTSARSACSSAAVPVPALPADDLDLRDADASCRRRRWTRTCTRSSDERPPTSTA